ncbi:putative C6 transcription factor [Aspergillus californicus]
MPHDSNPQGVSVEAMEQYALRAFFHDYCCAPINPTISRGFLGGLELMVHRQGIRSQVSKACKAVAFASHGVKLSWPFLTRKAEELYQSLLLSLADAIRDPKVAVSTDTAVMTTLLGLYEMISAGDSDPGHHHAHAGGLAAILKIENDPLALLTAVRGGHSLLSNTLQTPGIFSTPCHRGPGEDLDSLVLKLGPIIKASDDLSSLSLPSSLQMVNSLIEEATALNHELRIWQETRSDDFKPTTLGYINTDSSSSNPEVGQWPGRVDSYFDYHVATIWNISRTARCFLLYLMIQLSDSTGMGDTLNYSIFQYDAQKQAEDLIASVLYHFTEDIQVFLRDKTTTPNPGRPAGGLLLMHPLYVLSRLPIIPIEMKEYLKKCLMWIGSHMGIGQASLLAKSSHIDQGYVTSGCMIIWAALLV